MKGYLEKTPTEGISRMQMQHPVKNCNPLDPAGCETNFKMIADLPYCKQKTNPNVTNARHQENCEYFDEFDIQLPGYQQNSLMIPTRRTTYVQTVNCSGSLIPCPTKDKFKPTNTVYVANIEDYTLLIDHSFVDEGMEEEEKAWKMLGFVNPCGQGAKINGQMPFNGYIERAEKMAENGLSKVQHMDHAEEKEKKECEAEHFEPIHRPHGHLTDKEKEDLPMRNKAFAMWMESWDQTIVPFWPFNPKNEDLAKTDTANIRKIKNGDVIKVSDLLDYVDVELDAVDATSSDGSNNTANRYEGMVIIINIHYTNWKQYTWPNKLPPAYFYSFSLAPAGEYKLMQNSLAMHLARKDPDRTRQIYDHHGIFIIIKQSGCIGQLSWEHLVFILITFIFIEGFYRSLLLCMLLNCCDMDKGSMSKKNDHDPDELDHVLEVEFNLGVIAEKESERPGNIESYSMSTAGGKPKPEGYDALNSQDEEGGTKSPRPSSSREFDCGKGKPCCVVQ